MQLLRGLLDRLFLVAAALAGGLVPGFITQYRQRLGGRLDQARLDLAPWQKIADQFHQGSLEKLIEYHLGSADPKFHAEGAVIRSLVDSVQQLQSAAEALQHHNLFQQLAYLVLHADPGIARATFTDWAPTLTLTTDAALIALLFALGIWLLFHAVWRLLSFATERLLTRRSLRAATRRRRIYGERHSGKT
jgi:DUF2937 family protein